MHCFVCINYDKITVICYAKSPHKPKAPLCMNKSVKNGQ